MPERGIATAQELQADMTAAQRERYRDLSVASTAQARSFGETGVSADHAAKVIAKAATASRPRTRYTIGRDAAVLSRISRARAMVSRRRSGGWASICAFHWRCQNESDSSRV